MHMSGECSTTGEHSKSDQILLVKLGKYLGFWVYRRSYLLWFPAIVIHGTDE